MRPETIRQRVGHVMIEGPVEIIASATIKGAITNRVIMRNVKRPKRPRQGNGYRADKARSGKGTIQACVAFPPRELAQLDAMAARVQMSRSAFIRQAVKHFGARLFPDGKL